MKYLFILFLLSLCCLCFAQPCPNYKQLMDSGRIFSNNKQYARALNKFNAAKLCDPSKAEVDNQIRRVFDFIEQEKNEAVKQRNEAVKQTNIASEALVQLEKERKEQTSNLTALNWTSESENMNPIQGLRLLERAYAKANDKKALSIVREKAEKSFNQSITHQYHEKGRLELKDSINFLSPTDLIFSSNKWLQVIYRDKKQRVFEMGKLMRPEFLKEEVRFFDTDKTGDTVLVISEIDEDIYKSTETIKGKPVNVVDSIIAYSYDYGGTKSLISLDKNRKLRVDMPYGQGKPFLLDDKGYSQAEFTRDKKWLVLIDQLVILRIIDMKSGKEQVINSGNDSKSFFDDSSEAYDSIFLSPDSKWMVARDLFDKSAYVLQIPTAAVQYHLPDVNLEAAYFSADGRWMVIRDEKKETVRCWETATGNEVEFLKNEKEMYRVEFSPDIRWAITYNYGKKARIWEIATGKEKNLLTGEDSIRNSVFSPDKNFMAIHTYGNRLKLLDLASGNFRFTLDDITEYSELSFSEDSKWLATKDYSQGYKLWDVLTGKPPEFLKEEKEIRALALSPGSDYLATIDKNDVLKLWDMNSPSNAETILDYGDKKGYYTARLRMSHGQQWMLIGDKEQTETLIETSSLKPATFLASEKEIKAIEYSPDYKWVIVSNNTANKKIWELATGKQPDFLKDLQITEAVFQYDKSWLQLNEKDGNIRLFNLETRKETDFLKYQEIVKAYFSNDEKMLFTADRKGNNVVWNTITGEQHVLKNIGSPEYCLFSPDNKWLEIHYKDKTERYADSIVIRQITSDTSFFKADDEKIHSVYFSPNGKWVVVKDPRENNRIWETDSKRLFQPLYADNIRQVSFSADSNWMAIEATDDKLFMAKADTISDDFYFDQGIDSVKSFDFSPDSKWGIVTHANESVSIRNVATLEDFFSQKHEEIIEVEFSPDNRFLITRDPEYQYSIWELSSRKKVELAKKGSNIQFYRFSDDSTMLLAACTDSIKIMNVTTDLITKRFSYKENFSSDDVLLFSGKWLVTRSGHKLIVRDMESGEIIISYWTNLKATDVAITKERYLFIKAGNAIIKADLKTQRGNFFSYGDGESMDYSFEEIQEWITVFGDQYLLPLSDEIKEKYGIKEERK